MFQFYNTPRSEEVVKFDKNSTDVALPKAITSYDAKMLSYLKNLYDKLNQDMINIGELEASIKLLNQYNAVQQQSYLRSLLYPEKCRGCKVPSPIPTPSCSFQLHNSVNLKTNSLGNLCVVFNPFFLYQTGTTGYPIYYTDGTPVVPSGGGVDQLVGSIDYMSSMYINNSDTLTGSASDANFYPIFIGQGIPNVYDQYRLVSASIVVKYIGRLDETSGVIGGAVVYDEIQRVGVSGTTGAPFVVENNEFASSPAELSKYGNFDLAMDSFYHQENLSIDGIREIYFPIDNGYEEYQKLYSKFQGDQLICWKKTNLPTNTPVDCSIVTAPDNYRSGFNFMIYTLGAPANKTCFKLDIYCNFECLPNASFLNYLPISINNYQISNQEKHAAVIVAQKKPVMSLKEIKEDEGKSGNFWGRIKNIFGNFLPGIAKLAGQYALPIVSKFLPFVSNTPALNQGSTPMEDVE